MLLGAYSGLPPTALRFQYGPQGKPFLEGSDVQFNLSHSGNLALFAFARSRALGVDLEATDRAVEGDALAARFFSPAENAELAALPPEVRQAAFFACWTRKEAYIKATGLGLSLALDSFDVSVAPGRSARLLATRPRAEEATHWQLTDLSVGPGYAGALCVAGSGWTLHAWRWV
jgi:4'-phosphopantetheinyl transferase